MNTLAQTENNGNGQLAKASGFESFEILDPHSATGVSDQGTPRTNFIATISAGKRNEKGLPDRTKNGEIYVHGDAPALEAALKANDMKSITVAFPSNDPRDFIQQRFAEYSASALLSYGDGETVTEIRDGQRITHQSGTAEYKTVIERCKVSVSVYFMLAEWTDKGADMTFNDGFGLYRLRFTSRNSLQSILFSMRHMAQMTGGQIAGIPFDLFLRKEEHADGTGKKRPCWIWQCIPRPPKGIRLDATSFKAFAQHGVQQVGMLQLKAPEPETIDVALADVAEGTVIDLEAEEEGSTAGTPEPRVTEPKAAVMCDARDYQKRYFAIAGKSTFGTDEGRAAFVSKFSQGKMDSLSSYFANATEAQAQALCDELQKAVEVEAKAKTVPESPQATPVKPEINPALKRCCAKIISQAKQLWGENFKDRLADELGQPNFEGLDVKTMDSIIARFNGFIKEMEEIAKEAAAAQNAEVPPKNVDADGVIEGETGDASETAEAQGEPLQTPDNPLNKAVHARLEEAKNPASALFDDFDETDPFADDEPTNAYVEGSV